MDRIMRQLAAEEGYAHALCGLGTLVLLGVLLLIAAASVPATAGFGADLVWNGLLLLLAIVVPAAVAALLGAWPVRLPFFGSALPAMEPDDLAGEELRRTFQRILEYRRGIAETARDLDDGRLRLLLREVLRESQRPLPLLFHLAKEAEDPRQHRLLHGDRTRLRGKTAPLSAAEREQLASLERLDEVTRLAGQLVDDALAILGRCYAQTRELALVHDLADGQAEHLMIHLRDQAALLGHLTDAFREVHSRSA